MVKHAIAAGAVGFFFHEKEWAVELIELVRPDRRMNQHYRGRRSDFQKLIVASREEIGSLSIGDHYGPLARCAILSQRLIQVRERRQYDSRRFSGFHAI